MAFLSHLGVLEGSALGCESRFDIRNIEKTIWVFLTKLKELLLTFMRLGELIKANDQLLIVGKLSGSLFSLLTT